MKKLLTITAVLLWWSCTPQTNDCEPVYIDNPAQEKQIKSLTDEIERINAEMADKTAEILQHLATIAQREQVISDMEDTIAEKNSQISSLGTIVADQDAQLIALRAELEEKPDTIYQTITETVTDTLYLTEVVTDTLYIDTPVMPEPTVDEVWISHSNDDKANRRFFHYGSFEDPYPKNIAFETKEYCMITVLFPDDLANYREADSLLVRRIQDHELAETRYELVK